MSANKKFNLAARHIILILGSLIFVFPLYWLVTTSFKLDEFIFVTPPQMIPNPFVIENYAKMFHYFDFFLYLFNSLILVALNLAGVLITAPMVAFSFSRIEWKGRNICFALMLATIMLPSQVTMIPLYITYSNLGFVNTFVPLYIGSFLGGGAFNIFLIRQFLMTIPKNLEDSAKIDGANIFTIYVRIILPLITPALTTVSIFVFMGSWNDFMGPLIYLNDQDLFPLSIGLQLFNQQLGATEYGMLFAATTLMVIPVMVFFFLGQRKFIEGIVLTGMKA